MPKRRPKHPRFDSNATLTLLAIKWGIKTLHMVTELVLATFIKTPRYWRRSTRPGVYAFKPDDEERRHLAEFLETTEEQLFGLNLEGS
jgi:hypothetical protein